MIYRSDIHESADGCSRLWCHYCVCFEALSHFGIHAWTL